LLIEWLVKRFATQERRAFPSSARWKIPEDTKGMAFQHSAFFGREIISVEDALF
jgi:hypothetical protein